MGVQALRGTMTILQLESIRKSYGTKPLLEEITFGLEDDEKMGIIGLNGSGKTTLLRIIAGVEPPDSGRVSLSGGRRIAYLPQIPVFNPDQSVLDAVFDQGSQEMKLLHDYEAANRALEKAGPVDDRLLTRVSELAHQLDVTGGWELEANAKAILGRLGIQDTAEKIDTLSGGQRKRVALARALLLHPDLLILDEPTNHLDAETIAWLEEYLMRYTGALLLVTHDRYFLDRVTRQMLEIEAGRVQRYSGNYTSYLEKKEEQAVQREAENRRRENFVRRELAWLRRGAKARTTKQKARIDRAETLLGKTPDEIYRAVELNTPTTRLGKKVIDLEAISKSFDDHQLIKEFSYNFLRNDRIGIIGPNGVGKTTLLDLIAGRIQPDGGQIDTGQTVTIGYYDQESRALREDLRVIDYIKEVAEVVKTADGEFISASQMLERFLFPPAVQYQPVGLLSGGERRRLYLLRILMMAPNVLLLDEPTNDLDIPTLVALEEYLESFAGCLIVVSHDRYFLDRTIDHVFRFEDGGQIKAYPGNYSAFQEILQRQESDKALEPVREGKSSQDEVARSVRVPSERPKKLSYKEQRELEALEADIATREARKKEIETMLAVSPADYGAVMALSSELEDLIAQLDQDMERWIELSEQA